MKILIYSYITLAFLIVDVYLRDFRYPTYLWYFTEMDTSTVDPWTMAWTTEAIETSTEPITEPTTTSTDPTTTNIANKEPSFMCRTSGIFPDPHDCRRFHHCAHNREANWTYSPLEHFRDRCDCGYAYNSRSTFCDRSLNNDTCDTPLFTCRNKGDNGVFQENPSIYYICQYHPNGPLYPFVYACENGKTYDPYLYLCQ